MMRSPGSFLRLHLRVLDNAGANVCWECRSRLALGGSGRSFSTGLRLRGPAPAIPPRLKQGYFLSNGILGRANALKVSATVGRAAPSSTSASRGRSSNPSSVPDLEHAAQPNESSPSPPPLNNQDLPHRRRQAAKRAAKEAATSTAAPTSTPSNNPNHIPPDASAVLAQIAAKQPSNSLRRQLSSLLSLSKPRLTVLVVLTAMAPYALYPVPSFLSTTALAEAPSLSPLTLLFLTTGTALCSASANTLNMLYEPATDAKMSRTRNRPLVRGLVSTRAAMLFAIFCAVGGTGALYLGVNPTVAFLGVANIVLYAGVYTPMKAMSWLNTWVGALVGGIPPLMGWAAAAGESATGDGSWRELLLASDGSSLGGWLLATLLFAWQFPHFMALSWPIREEYRAAGLHMLAWVNPARNARVAFRYGLVFVPLCVALCAAGITEWSFAVTSLPVNVWLAREGYRFWRSHGAGGANAARGLFWASVWHLPALLGLALLQKKGMWGRVWRSVMGQPDLEEDDEGDEWEDVNEEDARVDAPANMAVNSAVKVVSSE